MDDLFSRAIVSGYTDAPRFVRRDWLAAELDALLDDADCRFVLLTAEPGAGKSAFVAQVAADHREYPVYFIRRDQRSALEGRGVRSVLLRIGLQLAAIHPDLFTLDQLRIEVEQRLGSVSADGDVVGAEIGRLVTSPFHQTLLRVSQQVGTTAGSLVGVRVNEWIAEPRSIAIDDLQNMALFDPARAYRRTQPDQRIVVLIDALDELRYHPDEPGLLDWLAGLPELPDNLRIVLTSRPSDRALATLRARQAARLRELTISPANARVQDDIRTYARALVASEAVAAALADAARDVDAFVTELASKADGNIGYLAALGRAFDQAASSPERRTVIRELLTLRRLPDDVSGLFAFFLQQVKSLGAAADVKVIDAATGRAALVAAWPEIFQPVLALLAIAQEPLSLDDVHVLSGTLADRASVARALEWLDQFLDRVGNAYRLYHSTFVEFLTSSGTRDDAERTDFFVDVEQEHRRLSRLLEGDGAYDAIWVDTTDPAERVRRQYARRHLVVHMTGAREWERLYRLIDDGSYGRGKLRDDPSTFLYSLDIDAAIAAVTRPDRDDAERLRDLPRLWRYKLLRGTLARYGDLPPIVYAAMAAIDRAGEAADLAELIVDPRRQSLAFANIAGIAVQFTDDGVPSLVAELMRRAFDAAERIVDLSQRAATLDDLLATASYVSAHQPALAADLGTAAVRVARTIDNTAERGSALAAVAGFLQEVQDHPAASRLREQVGALIGVADPAERTPLLTTYAMLLAQAGDVAAARAAAERIDDGDDRLAALLQIAALPDVSAGDVDDILAEATAIGEQFDAPGDQARTQLRIAHTHLARGDVDTAIRLLRHSLAIVRQSDMDGLQTLTDVTAALGRAGDAQGAAEARQFLYDRAIADLSGVQRIPGHGYTLSITAMRAAQALASFGGRTLAEDLVTRMQPHERYGVLRALVSSYVKDGLWDGALGVIDQILSNRDQSPVSLSFSGGSGSTFAEEWDGLIEIATALAKAGEWDRVSTVVDRIQPVEPRAHVLAEIAITRLNDGDFDAARTLVEQALRQTRRIGTPDDGVVALVNLLVAAHQWQQASAIASRITDRWARRSGWLAIGNGVIDAEDFAAVEFVSRTMNDPYARVTLAVRFVAAVVASRVARIASPVERTQLAAGILRDVQQAAAQIDDAVDRAEALRSIAVAWSDAGDAGAAHQVMLDAVRVLNGAPPFRSRPTPWCPTVVAFAKIGQPEWVEKISTGLLAHEAFDGCSALIDLARLARERNDLTAAEAYLQTARANAPRITFPPMQAGLLALLAQEYARLGKLDDAVADDIVTPMASAEAHDRIAAVLAAADRVDEARAMLAKAGSIDRGLAPRAVADAYMRRGAFDDAHAVITSMSQASDRGSALAALASSLFAAGRREEADNAVSAALDAAHELDMFGRSTVLQQIVTTLHRADERPAAVRLVEDEWRTAATRSAVLGLAALAQPLATDLPTIGAHMVAGRDWVTEMLMMN